MNREKLALEALENLSRLGNGDRPGNSEGNVIAQNALKAIAALTAEQPQKVDDSSITNLVDALEKLSKLGNGDKPGNSEGNRIAQQALEQYRLAEQTPEPNRAVVSRRAIGLAGMRAWLLSKDESDPDTVKALGAAFDAIYALQLPAPQPTAEIEEDAIERICTELEKTDWSQFSAVEAGWRGAMSTITIDSIIEAYRAGGMVGPCPSFHDLKRIIAHLQEAKHGQ
jgi:hypothetical protein